MNCKNIPKLVGCLLPLVSSASHAVEKRPNVVLILVDDLGWSDFGCYGSEIKTTTIDSIASKGIKYRQFYNAARSSPTRCSILTGLYTQQVAVDPAASLPNLRTDNNLTIAELLGTNGYRTYMAGKWHLGTFANQRDPISRGFQHVFGFGANVDGSNVSSYWDISQYGLKSQNNEIHWNPYTGKQFYQTDAIGDYAVRFINHSISKNDDKPFFLYMAFNAPHWPINAPADIANKYTDVGDPNPSDTDVYHYEVGWDSTRLQRFERQKALGAIKDNYILSPRSDCMVPANTQIPAWNTLDELRRNDLARRMSIYASMIQHVDENVKKVVDLLKAKNQLDSTLIMIVSDNGGNYENYVYGNPNARSASDLVTMGQPNDPGSFPRVDLGGGWANVANTPFRLFKHFTHEGGIRSPGIIFYPPKITVEGTWVDQPAHLIDVMATIVDVTGVTYPQSFKSHAVLPLEGVSLVPEFTGGKIAERQVFEEHEGNRALYDGDYKLVTKNFSLSDGSSPANALELYNIKKDPTELNNLATSEPARLKNMVEMWNSKASQVGVSAGRLITVPADPTAVELKFRFTFDDKLTDESTNVYSLTPGTGNGTNIPATETVYDAGKFGKALLLNGVNDYFDLVVNNILNPATEPFTACAWVYNTQLPTERSITGGGVDEEQVIHQLGARVVLQHIINDTESNIGSWVGGAQYQSTVTNSFALYQWQHIAVASDPVAKTNKFYVNGVQQGEPVSVTTTFTSGTDGFRIGAHRSGTSSFWHGKFDEVCLFQGVMNGEQIVKVMNNDYNITSVKNVVSNNDFHIFPNPANEILYLDNTETVTHFTMMTLDGKIVLTRGKASSINLSFLPSGNYLLKVQLSSGISKFKKVIVIH